MPIPVRELQMRISGSLTGVSGLGAMAATDLGAPIVLCWWLIGATFAFLSLLVFTTIRPHWAVYAAGMLSASLDRRLHRDAPPSAT